MENLIAECREKDVKGIYIMAAEMGKSDIYPFLELQIPIVTGDNRCLMKRESIVF